MKFKAIVSSIIICLFCSIAVSQEEDSDDLLLMIPAIISSVTPSTPPPPPPPTGLDKVKELAGVFKFFWEAAGTDIEFTEYFRFNRSSASATSDPTIFTIEGDSALSEAFSLEWCDGEFLGSYSTEEKLYLIVCDWGFPDTDLGSVYAFDSISNSFAFEHFFYTPSIADIAVDSGSSGIATRLANGKLAPDSKLNSKEHIKLIENRLIEAFQTTQQNKANAKNASVHKYQKQLNAMLEQHLQQ